MNDASHWNTVYETRSASIVSWFKPHLTTSVDLLHSAGLSSDSRIIDIGGGASTLVDDLLNFGVADITVLDLSKSALDVARARLGDCAARARWLVGNVLTVELATASFDLWHDRAAFHFFTNDEDVAVYVRQVARALRPGGHMVLGTFAKEGPQSCSGLPVMRRDPTELAAIFAPFELVAEARDAHSTPAGNTQLFTYVVMRLRA